MDRGRGVSCDHRSDRPPAGRSDLDEADRICRLAFGTFMGAPEPEQFFGPLSVLPEYWDRAVASRSPGVPR